MSSIWEIYFLRFYFFWGFFFWEKKQHVWWVMIGKCSVSLSPKRKLDRLHCVRKDVLEYCLLFHNSFCPPPSPLIETLIWFIAHFVLRLLIRLCDDDGGGGNWKEGKDLWSNEANQIWLVHLWTQKKARTGQTRIVVFSLFVVDFSPFFYGWCWWAVCCVTHPPLPTPPYCWNTPFYEYMENWFRLVRNRTKQTNRF